MCYCNLCKRKVEPVRKFNWWAFILTCLLAMPWLYLIWYLLIPKKHCPICGAKIK